jgi:hypothetical protein
MHVPLLMMLFREPRDLIIRAHIFQVQYIRDCKKVYGRILNNNNVESSTQTKSTLESEKVWKELYPEEPFELLFTRTFDTAVDVNPAGAEEDITYDLVSAVKRQSSFYYQVLAHSSLQYICYINTYVIQDYRLTYKQYISLF